MYAFKPFTLISIQNCELITKTYNAVESKKSPITKGNFRNFWLIKPNAAERQIKIITTSYSPMLLIFTIMFFVQNKKPSLKKRRF